MLPCPRLFPLVVLLLLSRIQAGESLEAVFAHPPAGAHPHTWWHWNNGNVTREGITLDLEAMHRIGVTGAQIFNVRQCDQVGPVATGSQEWRDLTAFAVAEAARLGIVLAIHNCPGWSESGGPWITPEQSMQKVVWTETCLSGGRHFTGVLAHPETIQGYYRDIAVLAFHASAQDAALQSAATSFAVMGKGGTLSPVQFDGTKAIKLLSDQTNPPFIQIEFSTPVQVASLLLKGSVNGKNVVTAVLEASEDGQQYRRVATMKLSRSFPAAPLDFPAITARFLRIAAHATDKQAGTLSLSSIACSGARLHKRDALAGYRSDPDLKFSTTPMAAIERSTVIDLGSNMDATGRLDWEVPAGDWMVLRLGHTSTGKTNAPAPASGTGLECDKMSRGAVESHFAGMMAKVIADAGPLAGTTLTMVLADSWEAGCQNWTPAMREEFTRRRGYDPTPWLPCIAGYAIGSQEESERFLWDFRRTIADLIAENHYGTFQELCHQHHMLFTAEAPGIGMPTIADQLQCKARTDVPMGEFWMDGHHDSREPACAAHIGGQQIAAAESFTAKTGDARWSKAPFDHKALGDLHFTYGINRFVFHRYAMQPWTDRFPGMSMGPWGTNFERTNTWWEQAKPWMDYLSRSQALLQSGLFKADILYLYGEGAPVTLTGHEPKIPAGYGYDAIDAEALQKNLSVSDGRLILPSGMSYQVLLLPPTDRCTPGVLRKIRDLTMAGASIIGMRPSRSPSLSGYPQCDGEIAALAAELWGDAPGENGSHALGKGRVGWGPSLATLLLGLGIKPDFQAGPLDTTCAWIHRCAGEADIYFVSNQSLHAQRISCTFRVSGKVPELWHADTGSSETAPEFSAQDGATTVPLQLDPAGSVFVIFRPSLRPVDGVVAVTRNGSDAFAPVAGDASAQSALALSRTAQGALMAAVTQPGRYEVKTRLGTTLQATVEKLPEAQPVAGPWLLHFPPKWGAPEQVTLDHLISWSDHQDQGVRHFSGTATYTSAFAWQAVMEHGRYYLDLGVVKEIAQVSLNGKDLGILWKPPFRVEITDSLQPGSNSLEIRVTNLWPNRLIGDAAQPQEQRLTWASFQAYKADEPLLPSGLLGPVTIQTQAWVELR